MADDPCEKLWLELRSAEEAWTRAADACRRFRMAVPLAAGAERGSLEMTQAFEAAEAAHKLYQDKLQALMDCRRSAKPLRR